MNDKANKNKYQNLANYWIKFWSSTLLGLILIMFVIPIWAQAVLVLPKSSTTSQVFILPQSSGAISADLPNPTMINANILGLLTSPALDCFSIDDCLVTSRNRKIYHIKVSTGIYWHFD